MERLFSPPLILGAVAGGLGLLFFLKRRSQKLPPGPFALPLIGNVYQLAGQEGIQNKLLRWAHEYGEVYTIWLFNTPAVIINSKDAIREALLAKSVEFADRPQSFSLQYLSRGGKVIGLGTFSEEWRNQKKMAATSLRLYGDGLQRLEAISQDVLRDFTAHLESLGGQPVQIAKECQKAIVNVITSLVFGKQFSWNDPDFEVLEEALKGVPGISVSRSILDAAPWIRHFVSLPAWKSLERTKKLLDEFFDRHLEETKANYNADDIKCFADAIYQQTLEGKSGRKTMEYDLFVMTVFGVFLAGFATTSTAMAAFILICLHHPEVERKLVAEIQHVLGHDRLPSLDDKKNMPYLEACILEVLRYASHVPVALPHMTYADVDFKGYHIPKGTTVFMHVNNLHHDEKEWTDPWTFRPERFIDSVTGEVVPPGDPARQAFLAFGAGRRVCIGETLARNRLFLFIAGLYQKFKLIPEEGATLPPYDPRKWSFNFVMTVPNYRVKILPR